MINDDLISRSDLMKYINENHSYAGLPMAAHICTMELLTYAPAVDAVEVVRCMYCTKAKNSEYNRIVWCTEHQCRKLYMDFCSKGDRTHEPVYMRSAKMDGDNE